MNRTERMEIAWGFDPYNEAHENMESTLAFVEEFATDEELERLEQLAFEVAKYEHPEVEFDNRVTSQHLMNVKPAIVRDDHYLVIGYKKFICELASAGFGRTDNHIDIGRVKWSAAAPVYRDDEESVAICFLSALSHYPKLYDRITHSDEDMNVIIRYLTAGTFFTSERTMLNVIDNVTVDDMKTLPNEFDCVDRLFTLTRLRTCMPLMLVTHDVNARRVSTATRRDGYYRVASYHYSVASYKNIINIVELLCNINGAHIDGGPTCSWFDKDLQPIYHLMSRQFTRLHQLEGRIM